MCPMKKNPSMLKILILINSAINLETAGKETAAQEATQQEI